MAVDFPTGVPNIPSANGANPLSTTHGAGVSQAAGTNRILTNLVALATKLGITSSSPTPRRVLAGLPTTGQTGWADVPAPTFLVAASNAHAASRALANYVCDGTDDQVEINTAIAALPATVRGRVLLSEGTFTISAQIAIGAGSDNTTLEGMGIGATELRVVQGSGGATAINGVILSINALRVRVANLFLSGTTAQTSQILIYGTNAWGVLDNVRVSGSGAHGIFLDGNSNGWVVDRCVVAGNLTVGILANNNSGYGTRITNCHVYGNGSSGIEVQGGQRTLVAHNSCIGNTGNGISTAGALYTQILDNVSRLNNGSGIYVGGGTYSSVQGNLVQSSGQYGIQINNAHASLVVGNWVDSNSTITNNSCDGILFVSSDYCFAASNTVRRGGGANRHRYGLATNGTGHLIGLNDLYDSGVSGSVSDGGTNTRRVAKLQLDYNPTADLFTSLSVNAPTALTADANGTFQVNNPDSVVWLNLTSSIYGSCSGGIQAAVYLTLDGATLGKVGGVSTSGGQQFHITSTGGFVVQNLTVGAHTLKVWAVSSAAITLACRPTSNSSYEGLRLQAVEYAR
jgi:hypothetical protein